MSRFGIILLTVISWIPVLLLFVLPNTSWVFLVIKILLFLFLLSRIHSNFFVPAFKRYAIALLMNVLFFGLFLFFLNSNSVFPYLLLFLIVLNTWYMFRKADEENKNKLGEKPMTQQAKDYGETFLLTCANCHNKARMHMVEKSSSYSWVCPVCHNETLLTKKQFEDIRRTRQTYRNILTAVKNNSYEVANLREQKQKLLE